MKLTAIVQGHSVRTELLLFHGHISSLFELVLKVRAPIFGANPGPEAAVSGGAIHIVLRQVITVTLGGVLQQRVRGGLLEAIELDELPPNLVNTGRLILNILILAPEKRNFQKFILVKSTWVGNI